MIGLLRFTLLGLRGEAQFRNEEGADVVTRNSLRSPVARCLMTPTETIIATTFAEIPLTAAILGDRVILYTNCQSDVDHIVENCDALLPPLELTRAPKTVYLHCEETHTYLEIDSLWMRIIASIHDV
ncbi:MAG: hypothetical protein VKL39_08435 [Leptolyngbyaceae bacterium]|nr:hypothetical protein [Leptolyngbyaceae bacterium]